MMTPYHSFGEQAERTLAIGRRAADPERHEHGQHADEAEGNPLRDQADPPEPLDPVAVAQPLQGLSPSIPWRFLCPPTGLFDVSVVTDCRARRPLPRRRPGRVARARRALLPLRLRDRPGLPALRRTTPRTSSRTCSRAPTSVSHAAGRRRDPALARAADAAALHRPASRPARASSRSRSRTPSRRRRTRSTELDEAFAVHEALAELPENCREILDRFFARDESYRTIGDALDLPSGTIASRISRCLVAAPRPARGRNARRTAVWRSMTPHHEERLAELLRSASACPAGAGSRRRRSCRSPGRASTTSSRGPRPTRASASCSSPISRRPSRRKASRPDAATMEAVRRRLSLP